MIRQKLVVVGDGAIGKTSLLIVFTKDKFPHEDKVPKMFESGLVDYKVDGEYIELALWETTSDRGEDFVRLRPLGYFDTNAFLFCYSIENRVSFENILTYWIPEVQKHCPNVPIILCGNKLIDLRDDQETLTNLEKQNQTPVTKEEGIKMAADINAYAYVECSAKTKEGVREVFEEAVRAAFTYVPPKRKTKCDML